MMDKYKLASKLYDQSIIVNHFLTQSTSQIHKLKIANIKLPEMIIRCFV